MTTTAAASCGDAGHPAVRDNAHHNEPQSKARGKEEEDLHHHHHHYQHHQQQQPGSVSHCMFPYCWPSQSVPAQYAPSQSSLSQPPDLLRALSSRPQGGLFGSEPPPFLMGCSVPSDTLASMLSCGTGPGPIPGSGPGPGPDPDPGPCAKRVAATAAGVAGLSEDSRLSGSASPVPTSAAAQHQQQGAASWSISDVDVSELDLGNTGGNVSPSQYMSLASKLSHGGGGGGVGGGGGGSAGQACGTGPSSSSTSSSSWPDVPCPVAPMQRMIVPFGLPPPSLLTLPPGWGPPRTPPLPPRAPQHPGLLPPGPCRGDVPEGAAARRLLLSRVSHQLAGFVHPVDRKRGRGFQPAAGRAGWSRPGFRAVPPLPLSTWMPPSSRWRWPTSRILPSAKRTKSPSAGMPSRSSWTTTAAFLVASARTLATNSSTRPGFEIWLHLLSRRPTWA